MNVLNSTNSGVINRKGLKEALMTISNPSLDIETVVEDVFGDKTVLNRSVIRDEMNQNIAIVDLVSSQSIQDQIMMKLESLPSSFITLVDVNKAVT